MQYIIGKEDITRQRRKAIIQHKFISVLKILPFLSRACVGEYNLQIRLRAGIFINPSCTRVKWNGGGREGVRYTRKIGKNEKYGKIRLIDDRIDRGNRVTRLQKFALAILFRVSLCLSRVIIAPIINRGKNSFSIGLMWFYWWKIAAEISIFRFYLLSIILSTFYLRIASFSIHKYLDIF